ncbi:MAG: hypothetical protein GY752_06390 [bacterium]|nr:hypothetical protein [bacterium]MCP4798970.1 hypothetical protein [bacterium]
MKKLLLVALTLIVSTSAFAGVIYDLNTGVYADGDLVSAEGVITAVRYNGFSMTELPVGPYSAVWVYCGDASTFTIGDEVVITDGQYTEYYDLSEIIQTDLLQIAITGNNPIAPLVMTVAAAAADYEPWESGVITFTDGFWVTEILSHGQWSARSYDSMTNLIHDDYFFDETTLAVEMCYDGVTGMLTYNYGEFKMNPFADGLVVGDCVIANEEVSFGSVKALYR